MTETPDTPASRPGPPTAGRAQRVLLITGMSGAGKTSALKALEDLGYEAVDNVPLSLVRPLLTLGGNDAGGLDRPIAVGVDVRTRDFAVGTLLGEIEHLGEDPRAEVKLVFIDCDDEELGRRYAETRHRHPLAQDRPVADGIAHERRLMAELIDRADLTIDTTGLGTGGLKRILEGNFRRERDPTLAIFVVSFAYRRGLPREADLVFDVRFLANPHYDPALRPKTGRDADVAAHVAGDGAFGPFFDGLTALVKPLLPRFAAEGKSYLTIAFGCTGGRHRSVFLAERMAEWLQTEGEAVTLHHRELGEAGA